MEIVSLSADNIGEEGNDVCGLEPPTDNYKVIKEILEDNSKCTKSPYHGGAGGI